MTIFDKKWVFVTWARDVTDLHGIKHIVCRGSRLRKTIWLFFVCASIGAFTFMASRIIKQYFQFNHSTKVDIVATNVLDFPSVTLCNFNKYRTSALTMDDLRNVGLYLGVVDENHNLIYPHLYNDEFVDKLAAVNWDDVVEDEDYNMTDFTIRTGHQLEDLIQSCKWKEEECGEDFVLSLTHLGACYTFNKYNEGEEFNSHNSTTAGAANGLQLIIDIEEIEYTPTNDLDAGAMDAGVKIMLHRPTEPPYVKELGFAIAPGLHTFVKMRNEKITSEPDPYTECEQFGDIQYFDHYSLQACRIECETKIVEKYCSCKLPEQPGDFRVCNPAETHECAHEKLLEAIEGLLPDDECVCRSPCEVVNYISSLSSSRLRPGFIKRLFQDTHNMTEEYIQQNIAVVTIFYEALNYEEINQIPEMSITTLLAIMGGNMGLFLGGSALTIIQILEYCYDEAVGCCTAHDDKKKRPKSPVVVAPVNTIDSTAAGAGDSRTAWGYDNNGVNGNF
ncbi:putative acid-sensing ion channel 1 [Apostichopus japonicus]|uniref:Putative acid-sensing ion channel 1 n=1 Tax=Stichopus japonicus TaxID=307972 RepID=A0A2G8KQN8_STIJA|nr:putative acid-sensing ion channel 1 [Apostichopus japonicus]